MPAPGLMQAFSGGGGAAAPSPFRAPAGIPDPRAAMLPPAQNATPDFDIRTLLRGGAISAEQILAMVAALAGMGQAPQQRPNPQELLQAFLERQGGR